MTSYSKVSTIHTNNAIIQSSLTVRDKNALINFSNNQLKNVGMPSQSHDAVNKKYVDEKVSSSSGVTALEPVHLLLVTLHDKETYNFTTHDGTGIKVTKKIAVNGSVMQIDDVEVLCGLRVLFLIPGHKNQVYTVNAVNNAEYTLLPSEKLSGGECILVTRGRLMTGSSWVYSYSKNVFIQIVKPRPSVILGGTLSINTFSDGDLEIDEYSINTQSDVFILGAASHVFYTVSADSVSGRYESQKMGKCVTSMGNGDDKIWYLASLDIRFVDTSIPFHAIFKVVVVLYFDTISVMSSMQFAISSIDCNSLVDFEVMDAIGSIFIIPSSLKPTTYKIKFKRDTSGVLSGDIYIEDPFTIPEIGRICSYKTRISCDLVTTTL